MNSNKLHKPCQNHKIILTCTYHELSCATHDSTVHTGNGCFKQYERQLFTEYKLSYVPIMIDVHYKL